MVSLPSTTHDGLLVEPELLHVSLVEELVGDLPRQLVLLLPRLRDRRHVARRHQHPAQHCEKENTDIHFSKTGDVISIYNGRN